MKDPDQFAPTDWPTPDQQLDALQKGLGRAVQWAKAGRLADGPLLAACLTDLRYDAQIEEPRGDWLWGIIEAVGAVARFRDPILDALIHLPDPRSADQLCALACHYALAGDTAFRDQLRAIVATKPSEDDLGLGEEEVIRVDGEAGFLFTARLHGQLLAGRDWGWDEDILIDLAVKHLGDERVRRLLSESTDESVARFAAAWRDHEAGEAERSQARADWRKPSLQPVEEVLRTAATTEMGFWFSRWGQSADEVALRTVAERLWAASEPREIVNLLRVFSARALPEFDPRLLALGHHAEQGTREAAFIALGQNTHSMVRDLAMAEIARGIDRGSVVGLLVKNYQQGDETRILEALRFPADLIEVHWILTQVRKVLRNNPEADGTRLTLLAYEANPCACCRADALKVLFESKAAHGWLKEECRYDANDRCRASVGTPDST